ncbi:hypothetical protein [Dyadobacter fermentans]|uniref:Uncharacterized protein n=1 Tax=Dyadobacter fermentans (strain ATCC 700827 / DSM 18053 / CIP 107007 / KCTC 52180 / NS114) TaxID=471854 RepID=C6VRR8_DYAFD|nr:hypothetical protein [Dyadobacter fermentans]ACT92771.1 hypothetical protein Dfer_1526 [Dyadobacter fermentans DSM 18053]
MESTISLWAGAVQIGIAVAIAAIGIRIILELRKTEWNDQAAE